MQSLSLHEFFCIFLLVSSLVSNRQSRTKKVKKRSFRESLQKCFQAATGRRLKNLTIKNILGKWKDHFFVEQFAGIKESIMSIKLFASIFFRSHSSNRPQWKVFIQNGGKGFFYSSLVRAKVKGFQTLSKIFWISSIRSKSAQIKTRAEKYNGWFTLCSLSTLVLIRADLLQIEGWNFGVSGNKKS